jgi:hypothetical protein
VPLQQWAQVQAVLLEIDEGARAGAALIDRKRCIGAVGTAGVVACAGGLPLNHSPILESRFATG